MNCVKTLVRGYVYLVGSAVEKGLINAEDIDIMIRDERGRTLYEDAIRNFVGETMADLFAREVSVFYNPFGPHGLGIPLWDLIVCRNMEDDYETTGIKRVCDAYIDAGHGNVKDHAQSRYFSDTLTILLGIKNPLYRPGVTNLASSPPDKWHLALRPNPSPEARIFVGFVEDRFVAGDYVATSMRPKYEGDLIGYEGY